MVLNMILRETPIMPLLAQDAISLPDVVALNMVSIMALLLRTHLLRESGPSFIK